MNRRRALVAAAVVLTLLVVGTALTIRPEGAATAQLETDKEPGAHRVYLASRRVGTAGLPAEQRAAELQQLDLQNAKATDQGLVLTLGDVLFTSGRADLQPAALFNLNKLVNFLDQYPQRKVAIQGYTDNLGSEEYNQGLSERRADSVKAYLVDRGIDSTRLSAAGSGQSAPVAGNDSGADRQRNRRVEVVISNPRPELTQQARRAKIIVLLSLLESTSGGQGRPLQ